MRIYGKGTGKPAGEKVGGWTRGQVREQARTFIIDHSKAWAYMGATVRIALFDAAVLNAVWAAGTVAATVDVADLRAYRQAFIEECTAFGYGAFDGSTETPL
jgi:hypothetical protein